MNAPTLTVDAGGPVQRAIASLARRMGCTEGQAQTIALGLVIALVAGILGLPPVFDEHPFEAASATPTAPEATPDPAAPDTPPSSEPTGDLVLPPAVGVSELPPTEPVAPVSPAPVGPAVPGEPADVPGADGNCDMTTRSIDNPASPDPDAPVPVWIYEPTGSGAGTITGGSCDDSKRPTVFIAHGFGQSDPVGYAALIHHFVSIGNVVVYPTYDVNSGDRAALEASYRVVDAGFVAAARATPRIDTKRVGLWGHSHGGGMIPYLTQRTASRGWGRNALWMSIVAQAYTQLVGDGDITVPRNAQEITVAFQHDGLADARLGIDVYGSLELPESQKRHVTIQSGTHDGSPFLAEHGAPEGVAGHSDAVDVLLWRYADLMELCALRGVGCDADLSSLTAGDGAETQHAVSSRQPVDVGPYPAVLAECDAGFGPTLNPRIRRCGPTKL